MAASAVRPDSMDSKSMSVHEVAKLTGITARTLHYYDEIGILKPTAAYS